MAWSEAKWIVDSLTKNLGQKPKDIKGFFCYFDYQGYHVNIETGENTDYVVIELPTGNTYKVYVKNDIATYNFDGSEDKEGFFNLAFTPFSRQGIQGNKFSAVVRLLTKEKAKSQLLHLNISPEIQKNLPLKMMYQNCTYTITDKILQAQNNNISVFKSDMLMTVFKDCTGKGLKISGNVDHFELKYLSTAQGKAIFRSNYMRNVVYYPSEKPNERKESQNGGDITITEIDVDKYTNWNFEVHFVNGKTRTYTHQYQLRDETYYCNPTPIAVYGVKQTKKANSIYWERTGDAQNMEVVQSYPPIQSRNDFDSVSPWKDIKKLNDGSLFIPKFYYKRTNTDEYDHIQITDTPLEGFTLHPASGWTIRVTNESLSNKPNDGMTPWFVVQGLLMLKLVEEANSKLENNGLYRSIPLCVATTLGIDRRSSSDNSYTYFNTENSQIQIYYNKTGNKNVFFYSDKLPFLLYKDVNIDYDSDDYYSNVTTDYYLKVNGIYVSDIAKVAYSKKIL